jgi:hypothetical protein
VLFAVQMQRVLQRPVRDLAAVMQDIGEQAARDGLTQEVLDDILNEKPT